MPLFSKISRGIWPFDGAADNPELPAALGGRGAGASGTGLENQRLESGNVQDGDFTVTEGMDGGLAGADEGQELGTADQQQRGKSVFFEAGTFELGDEEQVDGDVGEEQVVDAEERVGTAKGVKKEQGVRNRGHVPDAGSFAEEQMEGERQGQELQYIKNEPEDEEGHGVGEHEEEQGEYGHDEDQGVDQLYDETNEFLQRVAEKEQAQDHAWAGSSHQHDRRRGGYGQNPDDYFNQMAGQEQQVPYQRPNMAMYGQRRIPPVPYQGPPPGAFQQDPGFDPRGMFGHGLGNFQGQFYGMDQNHQQGYFPQHPHHHAQEMHGLPQQYRHQYTQDYPPQYHKAPGKRKAVDELLEDSDDDEQSSDDDEPLKTRTQRQHHEDLLNDQESPHLLSTTAPHGYPHPPDTEYMGTFSRPKKPAPLPRALPRSIPQAPATPGPSSNKDSSSTAINWKLPTYEVRPSTPIPNSVPSLKISLPGQVREELLLSPDHSAQETHLLTHLFIPAQQALTTPDPEPALATLNFHTIAVMVLDAYAQFELGDEFSGQLAHRSTQDSGEGKRIRNAKDADVDEIFFQVIDRWRVGMAHDEKKSYRLIRGVQEFCDVALDIIFWVRENGLLREGEGRVRKERSDKGKKRGPKGMKQEDGPVMGEATVKKGSGSGRAGGTGEGTGGSGTPKKGVAVKKTGTAAQPNELKARKKPKTDSTAKPKPNEIKPRKKQKAEPKPVPKKRGKAPALVVFKAQGKRK